MPCSITLANMVLHDSAIKALHNAARRYCIESADELSAIQRESGVREEQYVGIWLLGAILEEIERSVPQDFALEGELREYLLSAGKKVRVFTHHHSEVIGTERRIVYLEPDWTEAERIALEKARADYITYVTDLSVDEAAKSESLLYRHVMSDKERYRVARKLAERWGVRPSKHYWYPLSREEMPSDIDVLALQEEWFRKEVGVERLQSILLVRGIKRIWELDEFRVEPEYELDPRLCAFWKGAEGYWSSRELD